jgi:signal peptidase I
MALLVCLLLVIAIVTLERRPSLRPFWAQFGFTPLLLRVTLVAMVLLWLLTHFVGRLVYVPSRSMLDTLQVHDVLVVNGLHYRLHPPERGDIAIFDEHGVQLVKRVVAIGGDRLGLFAGKLWLNGRAVAEPYLKTDAGSDFALHTVPPGCFFALGDNRGNSMDSRSYGDVPVSALTGRVSWRCWPLGRAGRVQ